MVDVTANFESVIEETVRGQGVAGVYEIHVYEAGKAEMERLGKKWMKDGEFHEVISFPLEEKGFLGEIVVWKDAADKPGLIQHSCLHLLGIHHD